jgi:hypothetical protein
MKGCTISRSFVAWSDTFEGSELCDTAEANIFLVLKLVPNSPATTQHLLLFISSSLLQERHSIPSNPYSDSLFMYITLALSSTVSILGSSQEKGSLGLFLKHPTYDGDLIWMQAKALTTKVRVKRKWQLLILLSEHILSDFDAY